MDYFRKMYFNVKWITEEVILLFKHPSRKETYRDLKYHCIKLLDESIFYPWYSFKRGVKNLFKWFPLIWRNDIWDYYFLLDMMDKQLKYMEKFWAKQAKDERTPTWEHEKGFRCQYRRIWKRIRWTRKLMDMWREEHYAIKFYEFHHTLFPDRKPFEHDEKLTKYDEYGVPILYTCKPMPEDEKQHYSGGSEKARQLDEKVFKLWLKNMGYIRNWWH